MASLCGGEGRDAGLRRLVKLPVKCLTYVLFNELFSPWPLPHAGIPSNRVAQSRQRVFS